MHPARLLLTVDESPGSLAAARGLRAGGYEVHVAPSRQDTYVARSRAVAGVEPMPPVAADPDRYARGLAERARALGVAAVLPGTESTLRALTCREVLFEGIPVGTAPTEALELATSKAAFQRLAAEAGLETIPAIELGPEDVDERLGELELPAILKPLRSVQVSADGVLTRRAAKRVDDAAALRSVLAACPGERWLAQRCVTGTLAAVGGVAWRGELICATHQVSPRIWPPRRGITAYGLTVQPCPAREAGFARLVERIGWSGICGLQFLLAEDHAYAIDLNPRIYGSIGLAIAAGQNLPAIWASLLLGEPPPVRPARAGVRFRVLENDLRALADAFRHGRRRDALRGLLPRRKTVHAVLSLHDPGPAAVIFGKLRAGARRGRMA